MSRREPAPTSGPDAAIRFAVAGSVDQSPIAGIDLLEAGLLCIGYRAPTVRRRQSLRLAAGHSAVLEGDGHELTAALGRTPGGAVHAWIGLDGGGLRHLFETQQEGRFFAAIGIAAEIVGAFAGCARFTGDPFPVRPEETRNALARAGEPGALTAPMYLAPAALGADDRWRRRVEDDYRVTRLTADHLLLVAWELERGLLAGRRGVSHPPLDAPCERPALSPAAPTSRLAANPRKRLR